MSGRTGETRVMWSSEPGATPGATPGERNGQPAWGYLDGRDGRATPDGQPPLNGATPLGNGASGPPRSAQDGPFAAMARTAPRMGEPGGSRLSSPPAPARSSSPLDSDMRETKKRKKVTDSARMPALRMNRRERPRPAESRPSVVYDSARAPGYLRVVRLATGLAALAAAWGVALVVAYLAQALWVVAPHQPVLTERYALYLVSAAGILWLAVIALAMIAVGAFSLVLALTRRGW